MPGFVTHYFFGTNAFKHIEQGFVRTSVNEHKKVFALGLQGPDIFFFYLPTVVGANSNIGSLLHKNKTNEFFRNLVESQKLFSKEEDLKISCSYITGFIGHYMLDTKCHPYVYSQVGTDSSRKTLGRHFSLETDIDREILYEYRHIKPYEFSHSSVIHVSHHELSVITASLNYAISKTYTDIHLKKRHISKAIVSTIIINRILSDKRAVKRKILSFLEKVLLGYTFLTNMLINDINERADACNRSKQPWTNPWLDSETSNLSVFEIMKEAGNSYLKFIPYLEDAMTGKSTDNNKRMFELLGNLSYNSGLDCDKTNYN